MLGTANSGAYATKGGSNNSGTQASEGGVNNSGAYATKGGSNNSGTQVSADDGGVNNTGNYATKGGSVNNGTAFSNNGNNTGNSASKGGQIQTGSNDVGGDNISKSNFNNGAKTWNLTKVSSEQRLESEVTHNTTYQTSSTGSNSTGAVSLSNAGLAGIQTVSVNSGLNSSAQASTSIAASASITF
jgi:hypothetical protein